VVGLHRKHANDLELREHCSSDSSTKSTGRNLSGSTSASNTANTGMSAGMTGMTGGGISLQTFKKLNREFIKEMQVRTRAAPPAKELPRGSYTSACFSAPPPALGESLWLKVAKLSLEPL
jgi:hypothetical protein